jgi:hypothetical protein
VPWTGTVAETSKKITLFHSLVERIFWLEFAEKAGTAKDS